MSHSSAASFTSSATRSSCAVYVQERADGGDKARGEGRQCLPVGRIDDAADQLRADRRERGTAGAAPAVLLDNGIDRAGVCVAATIGGNLERSYDAGVEYSWF